MGIEENFFDVLFEISSEDRYRILLQLSEGPKRVTQLAKILDLGHTEISRHVSRICDVKLAGRDVDGLYRLTPYGEVVLEQLQGFEFTSRYRKYFASHSLSDLPKVFVRRIGDLSESIQVDNVVDFLHFVESGIKEAKEYVWLQVDRFPLTAQSSIIEVLKKGVRFRIIEPSKGESGPLLNIDTSEEMKDLVRTRDTPLVEQRTTKDVHVYLFISGDRCAFAFPIKDGGFDYKGFKATDESALNWCRDLFNHFWESAEPRVYISPKQLIRPTRVRAPETDKGQIIVGGRDDPLVDAQAVQDAVDNYDEVILRGTFNLGTSPVIISRSVVIRGEGREGDVPLTKLYKSGWTFPFYSKSIILQQNRVFLVDGEGADVTIENIHFTDFEYNCLCGINGNSMTVKNNRITLQTGLGRGVTSPIGDQVIGIMQYGGFPGGVRIEGNYLDFALSYGPLSRSSRSNDRAEDPIYRPDLTKHDCYLGFGIDILDACGKVIIEYNIVRNMNARGIVASDNTKSAYIQIKNNTILSEIYGSYYGELRFAGFGIKATSGWHVGPAPHVEISDNSIRCDKINYCGIGLTGPELGPIGAEKLIDGLVKNNRVHLENGSIGIFTESCDGFMITDNTLSGIAYYGIGIFPGVDKKRTELGAHENVIEDNNIGDLKIKDPDEYSKNLLDESRYAGSKAGSATSHVWLNVNTKGNVVKVKADETVIDEGEDNKITYVVNE